MKQLICTDSTLRRVILSAVPPASLQNAQGGDGAWTAENVDEEEAPLLQRG